ncbi:RIP metalloprotease RseP [Pusillimonas sp. CC-YST705]|uniref:Zinc metalloprotease n=1 Tax=Mesopusillimonas faecipullorum TaxID=2755040 RepID=A0ABS8CBY4_9BURK|nr:RIP metalloprotease RseP [Mesopusillimonas faecipullorum]MCB5363114.1 RIP metalloprotease RseP [Mesopusillimonas faecipullorum]
MLTTLLAFAVALGLLITFHELGHYWVARLCSVRVLRFSLGFGRVLWRRTDKHGTEWALSAIPLGGYVKMLDDPAEVPGSLPEQAFQSKTVWQRIAIVAAGPAANLLLAALLYAGLSWVGTQEPAPVLAQPAAGTQAAQAGVVAGDRITAVDGQAVQSWMDARWRLMRHMGGGGTAQLELDSPGQGRREVSVAIAGGLPEDEQEDFLEEAGLALQLPRARVSDVVSGSAGALAGLQSGDIVVSVAQQADPSIRDFVDIVKEHPGQTIALKVLRDGAHLTLQATPQAQTEEGATVGRLGVMLAADFPSVTVSRGIFDGLWHGVTRTWETAWFSLKMMGRMLVGDISVKHISGPVTIADYAGQTARIGLAAYIGFLALISVSIGVLNLLPIPMLDGGHLLYYLMEIVRGKPVPEHWMQAGQKIGLGLLAALMSLAFFNDFVRLFS